MLFRSNFSITVQLQVAGVTDTRAYSITIFNPPFAISNPQVLPTANTTTVYSLQFTVTPSTIVTWAVTAGTLPAGLTLSSAGLLSGQATTVGNYSFDVTATDGSANSAVRTFTLSVNTGTLSIVQTSLPFAVQGSSYSTTLTVTGGSAPYQWSLAPGQTGLTID